MPIQIASRVGERVRILIDDVVVIDFAPEADTGIASADAPKKPFILEGYYWERDGLV